MVVSMFAKPSLSLVFSTTCSMILSISSTIIVNLRFFVESSLALVAFSSTFLRIPPSISALSDTACSLFTASVAPFGVVPFSSTSFMISSAIDLTLVSVFEPLPIAAYIRSLNDVSVPWRLILLTVFATDAKLPTAELKCLNNVNSLSTLVPTSFIASLSLPTFFGLSSFSFF